MEMEWRLGWEGKGETCKDGKGGSENQQFCVKKYKEREKEKRKVSENYFTWRNNTLSGGELKGMEGEGEQERKELLQEACLFLSWLLLLFFGAAGGWKGMR